MSTIPVTNMTERLVGLPAQEKASIDIGAGPVEVQAEVVPRAERLDSRLDPRLDPRPALAKPHHQKPPKTWFDKLEAFVSALSVRDNFWHRICSFIWLPFAFFSGIRMKQLDVNTFAAVLPFTRFNRNWYNAMAGAALLGNTEIAGGMYVFGIVGADYTVVCKHLDYKFLRPCYGPAIYKMKPREDLKGLVGGGGEFNCTLDLEVFEHTLKPGERERRVGKAVVTFHVTPKAQHKAKAARKAE